MELVIATYNIGKIREYRNLFTDSLISIQGLTEFPDVVEVAETGKTFGENAALKAAGYGRQTGKWVIADDSGLEVTALGGMPGVFSARYAGTDSDYTHKMAVLLDEIFESGSDDRSARFVCSIAIASEYGVIKFIGDGECRGTIAREARGTNGFGYDPVFIPNGFDRTFGAIPDNVKRRISHRAKALETILRYLRDFTAV